MTRDAATVIFITLNEARRLPNMLGRIAPVMLSKHGVYRCIVGDEKREYRLVAE